jgi:HNH endonuclease
LWLGRTTDDGYPLFDVAGVTVRAHRWAWEQIHGPLPPRWTLDHLCHTYDIDCLGGDDCEHTSCVRYVDHLEPLPPGENVRRRHARTRALRALRYG